MKKIILVISLLAFLTSCGPRRMKCGPGKRCVENNSNTSLKTPSNSTLDS